MIWRKVRDLLDDVAEALSFIVHWIIRLILTYLILRAAFYVFLIVARVWYKLFVQ